MASSKVVGKLREQILVCAGLHDIVSHFRHYYSDKKHEVIRQKLPIPVIPAPTDTELQHRIFWLDIFQDNISLAIIHSKRISDNHLFTSQKLRSNQSEKSSLFGLGWEQPGGTWGD